MPDTSPKVTLRPVDQNNLQAIHNLRLEEGQRRFIATNTRTLKQAEEAPEAWLRAIYADDTPVGLLLLHDEHLRNPPREVGYYFLWRIMVDADHQRRGYGRKAVDLVTEYVADRPHAKRLLSSYLPGEGGAEEFYQRLGFTPTGDKIDEDIEIELHLPQTNTEQPGSGNTG